MVKELKGPRPEQQNGHQVQCNEKQVENQNENLAKSWQCLLLFIPFSMGIKLSDFAVEIMFSEGYFLDSL